MKDAILFNSLHSLDFQDVRFNVVRIPEVSGRLKQAQNIWDQVGDKSFNFHNLLLSEDSVFLSNIKLKSLVSAVVQVGLFDRYTKANKKPTYLVGVTNSDSAAKVCAGLQTFEDMIKESGALTVSRPTAPLQIASAEPILAGMKLADYGVFEKQTETAFAPIVVDGRDLKRVIHKIVDELEVKKIVNIGPGYNVSKLKDETLAADVQWLESIEADPMLSWFWNSMDRGLLAMAQ